MGGGWDAFIPRGAPGRSSTLAVKWGGIGVGLLCILFNIGGPVADWRWGHQGGRGPAYIREWGARSGIAGPRAIGSYCALWCGQV